MISSNISIRPEASNDAPAIYRVTQAAFASAAHSSGTEGAIVDALRSAGAMTVSLVAEADGEIIGHVSFSPVMVGGQNEGWFGLGPVSVEPGRQGQGIGSDLVRKGLDILKGIGAQGCVVMGDSGFYSRFGFEHNSRLRYEGMPAEYFMAQPFGALVPHGSVAYHPAFDAS